MKKWYQRLVILICIVTFSAFSFRPKKADAFVPLVIGGVYVSYEVLLATATLCAAMGIVIVNNDQLVAMAEKFKAIPDFANHVIGHSVVQIEEYWFQFLVDRVSVDGISSISYNYAPNQYSFSGNFTNPFVSWSKYVVDCPSVLTWHGDYTSAYNSYPDDFRISISDYISSIQTSGFPYLALKYSHGNIYDSSHVYKGIRFVVSLDKSTLALGNVRPYFTSGRLLVFDSSWIEDLKGNVTGYFCGGSPNRFSVSGNTIDVDNFGGGSDLSVIAALTDSPFSSGHQITNYIGELWDYGNCSLPSAYDSSKVGDYGQVTSPAVPTDQAKHWGDVFGADQAGTIDMGKALDDLKAKGVDVTKPATLDGVNAIDISYPISSVQDIPGVDVGDISQDSSIPYVPDFDTPDSSSSADLDFTPLMIVTKKFPFSLPWDLALAVNSLSSDAVVPSYEFPSIPVVYHSNVIATIPGFIFTLSDLPFNDTLINIVRTFEIIGFCVFLIIKTRDLIRS